MSARLGFAVGCLIGACLAAGCHGCHGKSAGPQPTGAAKAQGSAGTSAALASLPAADAWVWKQPRTRSHVALPRPCVWRAEPVRSALAHNVRWTVDRQALGSLVVAESAAAYSGDAGPDWEVGRSGVLSATDGPAQTPPLTSVSPLSWWGDATDPVARDPSSGAWLAAQSVVGAGSEVVLWRGVRPQSLGTGDSFAAVDLGCVAAGCALLTTRKALVAVPGADLWLGRADADVSEWRNRPVELEVGSEGVPFNLAAVEPDTGESALRVVVTLLGPERLSFLEVKPQQDPTPLGELEAAFGAADAIGSPHIAALTWTGEAGADCAPGARSLAFQQLGGPRLELAAAFAPAAGLVRPLPGGYLILFTAPARCAEQSLEAEKWALFAVALPAASLTADAGTTAEPIAVASMDDFAVVTSGPDVDLWIRQANVVTWSRARCAFEP